MDNEAEDTYQLPVNSEEMVRKRNEMKKLSAYGLMLAALCFLAIPPPYAQSADIPVSFTYDDIGGGTYEYIWTVAYDGRLQGFGELEVYLPTRMNSATKNTSTLNGSTNNVFTVYDPAGPIVTYPWNALHFNAALTKWTQAGIHLESPPKDGFDPQYMSEIEFGTSNTADKAAGTYKFSYLLKYADNHYLTSFRYELHGTEESDDIALQKGTAYGTDPVPLPPSVLLLGSGLLGLAGWRRFRKN